MGIFLRMYLLIGPSAHHSQWEIIMSHLLAYWKIYWDEMRERDYHIDRFQALKERKQEIEQNGWGAKEEILWQQIKVGENLWVVGREKPNSKRWSLLLRLNVQKKIEDLQNGYRYRLLSKDFDFFDPENQPNLETILKKMKFKTGKSIPEDIAGGIIGKLIQNRRPLTLNDNDLLMGWVEKHKLSVIQ